MNEESTELLAVWVRDLWKKAISRPLSVWEADHYQIYAGRYVACMLGCSLDIGEIKE